MKLNLEPVTFRPKTPEATPYTSYEEQFKHEHERLLEKNHGQQSGIGLENEAKRKALDTYNGKAFAPDDAKRIIQDLREYFGEDVAVERELMDGNKDLRYVIVMPHRVEKALARNSTEHVNDEAPLAMAA